MSSVEIQLDDVQEMMIEKLASDDVTVDEFTQQLFDAALHNTYQQADFETSR